MSRFTKEELDAMSDEEMERLGREMAEVLTEEIDKELGTTKEERDDDVRKALKKAMFMYNWVGNPQVITYEPDY